MTIRGGREQGIAHDPETMREWVQKAYGAAVRAGKAGAHDKTF